MSSLDRRARKREHIIHKMPSDRRLGGQDKGDNRSNNAMPSAGEQCPLTASRRAGTSEISVDFRLPEPRAAADGVFLKKIELRGHYFFIFYILFHFPIIIWLVKN